MIIKIETRPEKILQNSTFQFKAILLDEKSNIIKIDESVFKWDCNGGVINESGLYTATSGGPCTVYASYCNVTGELTDSVNFEIEREAEKLQNFFRKKELDLKTDFYETKKTVLAAAKPKVTKEEMRQRAEQAREIYKKDIGAHTRAVIRMSRTNKSFINLILCLIAGCGFGISGMIILYDFNIYAILIFLISFVLLVKGGIVTILELKGPIEARIAEKYEYFSKNQDLLWLAIAIIAAVVIGASAYMLVHGVAISTIITLFTSLLALFLSVIGKATSHPGEVTKALTKRINKNCQDSYYTLDEKNVV